jgi:hypothetical protein
MAELVASTRYFNAGTTEIDFLPAIAAANLVPTRIEMGAGTRLSNEIADLSGWTVTGGEIDTPDLGSTFTDKIPGKTSVDDSSLTFYADLQGVDVRDVLPRGTTGFIMIMDGGDVAGQPADVFPVRVRSVGKIRSAGEDSARLTVSFSITAEPAEDVAIPT